MVDHACKSRGIIENVTGKLFHDTRRAAACRKWMCVRLSRDVFFAPLWVHCL